MKSSCSQWIAPLLLLLVLFLGCSNSQTTAPDQPLLSLSVSELQFTTLSGQIPPQQKFVVSNSGTGTLTFTVANSTGWLTPWPIFEDTVFVQISPGSLPVGVYYDTLIISSPEAINSPLTLPVRFDIVRWLGTSSDSLMFTASAGGLNPDRQDIIVSSVGGGPGTYTASTGAPWIALTNATADLPDTVGVLVDITGMASGDYLDSIIITSPEIDSSRTVVRCRLHIGSWVMQQVGLAYNLKGIEFADNSVGFASGFVGNTAEWIGVVFKTTDGGESWRTSRTEGGLATRKLSVVDAQTIWVAADSGRLLYTKNGGLTWTIEEDLPHNSDFDYEAVFFVNTDTGWAVGRYDSIVPGVAHTVDGGITWSAQTVPGDFTLNDVYFVDGQTGWIVGNHGDIFHTTDGGDNWSRQPSGTFTDLRSLTFVDANQGWVVGRHSTILHTNDGGLTWQEQRGGELASLYGISFADSQLGWAVGDSGLILHTTDGGNNWGRQSSDATETLLDVHFLDNTTGWIAGNYGVLLKTSNGGL